MPISFFTDDKEEITVKIFIAQLKSGRLVGDIDREELINVYKEEIDENSIEEQEMVFRIPTYGDSNRVIDASVRVDDSSTVSVSPAQLRFERLCLLAKRWSLKGPKGDVLPTTRENIRKLNPAIAYYFGIGLEKVLRDRGLIVM